MASPPTRGERGEDFRTASGAASARDDGMLDALVRDVRARQQMVREILVDGDEAEALSFVGSAKMEQSSRLVAKSMRATLGLTTAIQREARGAAALFGVLRTAAERVGAFVLLLGDLGSHHSDIGETVFRGFALADGIAPFVVINDNDAITARSFTLMHELAHIWIGASGVSGPLQGVSGNAVERFCNDVAGEFLLPSDEMADEQLSPGIGAEDALVLTADIARSWNVSQGVVAYRMVRNGWISDDVATVLFKAFAERWRSEKRRVKDPEKPGGPNYFTVRRSRLGPALLAVVRRALQGDTLTHTKAAKILGVSPSSVDPMLRDRRAA